MTQIMTLELLTSEYEWNIGSSKTLKSIQAFDSITVGNIDNAESDTVITTSNVTSNLFIGNLDGQVGTLSISGNMSGNVLIQGDGTNATSMNLEIELDDVNILSPGYFGSQTEIPTFSVDKYGRMTNVSTTTISTTLNLLDTTGDTGAVDLLNGDLRIDGTNNQIVSQVSGNTFTLSLDNDMNMVNLSLSGNLDVTKATTLNSTLVVGDAATLEESLDVVKASSLHSTLAVGGASTLEESLDVVKASSLHSTLAVGGATTLENSLVVGASSILHSTLAVAGATTLEESFDVIKASSLHSTLAVGGATTLESTLYVGELVRFNKDLVIQGNLTVSGTQTIIDTTVLAIEDNKIELNTDGDVQAFGIFANVPSHGGEISLYYETSSSRWEFNKDLYLYGNLTVSHSTTIQDSLDVLYASSLHSTLAVGGASTLKSTLDVVGASSLHSTLAVAGATTLEDTLEVVSNITTPNYIVKDNTSGNKITLVAPDLSSTSSYTLTLPPNDGVPDQFLQTDGSGTLSWVTPDDTKTIKSNVINTADYTTTTSSSIPLHAFEISYTPTTENSTVMLQHKIPYESSIHANQRINFKIEKSVNGGPATQLAEDILGPNNATGGTRGIYISNIISTTTSSVGDTVTFTISAKLDAATTALDTNGNTRKAGVRAGTNYGVGSVMLTEFKN